MEIRSGHGFSLSEERRAAQYLRCARACARFVCLMLKGSMRPSSHSLKVIRATPAVFGLVCAALAAACILSLLPSGSFAAHMAGQLFLMDIAAPLCVMAWNAGRRLPAPVRRWRAAATPFGAGALHAAVMWGWHIPPVFAASNGSPALHALMTLTFFGSGLLFWTGILRARGSRPGVALFWLFMTVMHSGLLGALLTFTPTPLYGATIADQHLGGAVMWVMGTLIYAAAGLAVAGRWLDALDRAPEHAA